MNLYEMLQERARVYEQMKSIQDKYEDKPMDGIEKDTYGNLENAFDDLTKKIEARRRQDERDRMMGEDAEKKMDRSKGPSLFAKALSGRPEDIAAYKASLTLGDIDQAGSLTAPIDFREELIKGLDDFLWMRRIARYVGPLGVGQTLGFPARSVEAADAEWVAEVAAAPEEAVLEYARREFSPHRLAKLIKLSKTLVAHAPIAEKTVQDEMIYRIGTAQESAYMTGNGSGKPLGIFTASASGIPTTRDISTGNTTTAVTFSGLIEAKYSLKEQYSRNAVWVMHRDLAKSLAKVKDGEQQFIWQPSVALGQPDYLLGHVVHMSEYAPNTYTAGNYAAVLGDFRYYWIADSELLTIQILRELYAVNNQIGYLFNYFGDGAPVVGEAFSRVTLASA